MPSIHAVISGDAEPINVPQVIRENPLEQQRFDPSKQMNAHKSESRDSSSQLSSLKPSSSLFFRKLIWGSSNSQSKTNEPTRTTIVREEDDYTLICTVIRPKYTGVFSMFNKFRWDASRELVDEFPVFGENRANGVSVDKDMDTQIEPEEEE